LNSKSKYAALFLSSILVLYAIVGGRLDRVAAQDSTLQQIDVFSQVYNKIMQEYVDEPSAGTAIAGAIRGLLSQVDPYGGFLDAKDVTFYKNYNPEKTVGIGVVLGRSQGFPMVIQVIPGSAAEKAGLKTMDVIEAIDGVAAQELNLVQVHGFLANPPDKPAKLTLIGPQRAEPETVVVNREVTKTPPSQVELRQGDIAYVRIPILAQGKVAEARRQLEDVLKKGATGVILDLRSSAGGKDEEGFNLANLFVESGTLGYVEGQKFPRKLFTASQRNAVTNAPLVVLVDRGTGGPAELSAAALAGTKRGTLVGTRTFGTGTLLNLIPLDGGNALLISVAKYHGPDGREILFNGVAPNVRVPEIDSRFDPDAPEPAEAPNPPAPRSGPPRTDEQRQMDRAIEILKELRVGKKVA
jgi:carboxyl-terminal processing protease